MAEFLIETYAPDVVTATSGIKRVGDSAARRRAAGTPVHVLHTIFMPDDQTTLVLFEAPAEADVHETMNDAGLTVDGPAVEVLTVGAA